MGGIFGGAGGTPPAGGGLTGFDANAVAQALMAAQGGGGGGAGAVTGGSKIGNVNPLAQMLAAQGPTYQPGGGPVNGWGMSGDRLARFTPQGGSLPIVPGSARVPPIYTGADPSTIGGGGAGGGGAGGAGTGLNAPPQGAGAGGGPGSGNAGGGGGLPAFNAGEDSMAYMLRIGMSQADAQAALAMAKANPGMSFQDIIAQGGYRVPGYSEGRAAPVGGDGRGVSSLPPGVSVDQAALARTLDSSVATPKGDPKFFEAMQGYPDAQTTSPDVRLPTTGSAAYQAVLAKVPPRPPVGGPRPSVDVLLQREAALRNVYNYMWTERPPHEASKAEKAAWSSRMNAAQLAYTQASHDTGLGGGGRAWWQMGEDYAG